MPYLILSDIHGNREALEAVLANAQGRYDRILCLGDLVGYGADPNFAVDWARANAAAIIRGNHDREVSDDSPLDSYRKEARDGLLWTRHALSAENLDYLSQMRTGPLAHDDFTMVHGSPLDEDKYLVDAGDVAPVLACLTTPLTFFGHTHLQGGFVATMGSVTPIDPGCALEIQPEGRFYLVNPGSVGQPRDGNWRAAYALYSSEERRVEFVRVPYNVGPTAEKIVLAGMPATLAARLLMGM
ncbi:MAG TPA: metallophosphoesterase family protein [Bryobacteraceae bacterium]|jgi:predicted phosphodiesterase|nr:metallophosphoesterase family protein [Bryobacteraceae bacterium]